jgi:DnaJ-class molecular chaperone
MANHYATLGISSAATQDEVRRAYRILARRYHPDLNPGKASEEKFKLIAEAYAVLFDAAKRRAYDGELEKDQEEAFGRSFDRAHQAYRRQQRRPPPQEAPPQQDRGTGKSSSQRDSAEGPGQRRRESDPPPTGGRSTQESEGAKRTSARSAPAMESDFQRILKLSTKAISGLRQKLASKKSTPTDEQQAATRVTQISIIEVSISILDAIRGVKKTVELSDSTQQRKISVTIPPGVRSGSVVRFRRKENAAEEVVLIVRVAAHPVLSISQKGLTVQIPITVAEAVSGTRLRVPTLDEPLQVVVEPGTQSGTELRLKGHGVQYRDGTRGDLFVRFLIRVPESPEAVGLKEKGAEIDQYYSKPVRQSLPKNLLEL